MQPPKQRIPIEPFDLSNEKMKEGFNVSSEGLKGVSLVFSPLPVSPSMPECFLSPPSFSHISRHCPCVSPTSPRPDALLPLILPPSSILRFLLLI